VKKHVDFKKVRNIGVLFLLEEEVKFKQLDRLVKNLANQGKDVKMIGMFTGKILPNFFYQKLKIDIFTKKDISFLGFPKGEKVNEFIEQPFDILLDFTEDDILPMDFILGMSKAGFKAGRYRNEMVKVLDFMIKKPDDMGFDAFINSMVDYITIFNTQSA
jgi:hypothetical protein